MKHYWWYGTRVVEYPRSSDGITLRNYIDHDKNHRWSGVTLSRNNDPQDIQVWHAYGRTPEAVRMDLIKQVLAEETGNEPQ